MDAQPPEPSSGSASAAAVVPPLSLPVPRLLSPAQRWENPRPGAPPCSDEDLAAVTAQLDLRKKDSIFANVPAALNKSIGNPLKPPNHVLAGRDIATVVSNLRIWGTMTEEQQRREVEKSRALSETDKGVFRRLMKQVNPAATASVVPTSSNESSTNDATTDNASSDSPPRRRRRTESAPAVQDESSGHPNPRGPSAPVARAQPFQHVGLASTEEQRAAILQVREEQLKAHRRRKMGEPAKKANQLNDAVAQKANNNLLASFAKSLTTLHVEDEKDSASLDCQNTVLMITYCDVKPSLPQGGAPLTMQSVKARKPTMRICAFGQQKAKAILQIAGQLLSPKIAEEDRPNVDLEWIIKEEERSYIDTMQRKISPMELPRVQPARQTLTSDQVQLAMPAGECDLSNLLIQYSFISNTLSDRYIEH